MTAFIVHPTSKPLLGIAQVPGDKSITHRALLLGALAQGTVRVRGVGSGADNGRSARAMSAMGVEITAAPAPAPSNHVKTTPAPAAAGRELIIRGVGLDGLRAPAEPIDCGNSGTTMRLLCGLLAGQRFGATLQGDASLGRRPMRRVSDPLARMGAVITGAAGARAGEIYPPLQVAAQSGSLQAIDYVLPVASAQVKSAVLLAGLYAGGVTRVTEPGSTRDHTERLLAYMGAPVHQRAGATLAGEKAGVVELDVTGWDRRLHADEIIIPADPSQAAFILVAALIAGVERVTVPGVCINPTRTGFLDVLAAMGARVELESMDRSGSEPIADLSVSRGAGDYLWPTVVGGDLTVRSIDELPILAVLAARASGVTEFRNAAELRVKESDRIATTCSMLRALGREVEEREDGFLVAGVADRPFRTARIDAAGDHRIAMAAAVAGLAAEGPVRIDGADIVDTSFPGFADALRGLGVDIAVEAD